MSLRLRPLRLDDEREARRAHAELAPEAFPFLLDWDPQEPWGAYVERLQRFRLGLDLPPDYVPATFLVAEVHGQLAGRVSIRHQLNEFLSTYGGHIGYGVRPPYRRRGYATEILRQALVIARAEGVDRVLVTCDDDNHTSARVIERAGGEFEDIRLEPSGIRRRRYWIN